MSKSGRAVLLNKNTKNLKVLPQNIYKLSYIEEILNFYILIQTNPLQY